MKNTTVNLSLPSIEVDYKIRNNELFNMDISHYHATYEIYYLLEGERIYFIKDQSYPIQKGDIVLIPPNTLHKTMTKGSNDHERLLISFDRTCLDHLLAQMPSINWFQLFDECQPVLRFKLNERQLLQEHLFKINTIFNQNEPDSTYYTQVLILELLILLNRFSTKNLIEEKVIHSSTHLRVFEIVRFINSNYMTSITLNSLSAQFYISTYYLSRLFKEVTGFSFSDYLNQIRLLEAKKLLRYSNFSITQLSELVGFESSTHFGRAFKKSTGITPSQYRKNSTPLKAGY